MQPRSSVSNFRPVHWFSKDEWKKAYLSMFGPQSNEESKKIALQILFVWKARNPYLPSAIESTLGLFEVDLQSPKDDSLSDVPDRLLRLMYSSVLMRFINHTLDDAQSKKLTLLQAAAQMNIPDWIISLRHEAAHGHELPSLDILKNATHFALNWLHDRYWFPEFQNISNYVTKSPINSFKDDFSNLLNLHNSFVVFQYPVHNKFRISDIQDNEIKIGIQEDMKKILKRPIKYKTRLSFAQNMVIDIMNKFLDRSGSVADRDLKVCQLLIDNDSLFVAGDAVVKSGENMFKELSFGCIKLWEPILTLFHRKNIIATLFNMLIEIVNNNEDPPKLKRAAAQWLKEISFALNKCRLIKKFNITSGVKENTDDTNQNLLRQLVNRDPKQKLGLTLDLLHGVPSELTNANFIHMVVVNVNPYLETYVKEFIELTDPKLNGAKHKLLHLVDIISMKNLQSSSRDRIYTLEDVTGVQTNGHSNMDVSPETNDIEMVIDNKLHGGTTHPNKPSIWQKSTGKHNWSSCPIGLLPWQNAETFSLFNAR
ncbi:uncharacterized protein LOC143914347 [Arctopsyche grandis]|uniref:uncharacterized protein LOC143914347 n=1 Tax=Arctopsyche grandis TaxID=121162 RepID=UPI00406D86DA